MFVVQDAFSKLVTVYPIRRATTRVCHNKLFNHYFEQIERPERILSDHGTQFTSPPWQTHLEEVGVTVLFSSIRHSQSNPVERTMLEIGKIFRTYCADKHTKWARLVPFEQDCLNLRMHQSTGYTPYTLHYNKLPKEKIFDLLSIHRQQRLDRKLVLQCASENLQRAFDKRCSAQKSTSEVDFIFLRCKSKVDS